MDTKEIIEQIEYQWGTIQGQAHQGVSTGQELQSQEHPLEADFGRDPSLPKHPCRIVRMSVGRLLVRIEEEHHFDTHALVAIEVPIVVGLVHIQGFVEQVNVTQDLGSLVSIVIADLEVQQRRKEPRYACQFPCRYTVMKPGETVADIRNRPQSVARVVDVSLNGMQFQDDLKLPTGTRLYVELMLPEMRVSLFGDVVHVFHRPPKFYVYGIKFAQMDDLAISQLNRIILQLRRREQHAQQRGPQTAVRFGRRRSR